jgi:hypothetical protein
LLCENIRDSNTASRFEDPEDLVKYRRLLSFRNEIDDTIGADDVGNTIWECY